MESLRFKAINDLTTCSTVPKFRGRQDHAIFGEMFSTSGLQESF
jgi:hypothetical protein